MLWLLHTHAPPSPESVRRVHRRTSLQTLDLLHHFHCINPLLDEEGSDGGEGHTKALHLVAAADASDGRATELAATFAAHADEVLRKLWSFQDELMFKYADGYTSTIDAAGQLHVAAEPYADWWLKAVGYEQGPPPVPP